MEQLVLHEVIRDAQGTAPKSIEHLIARTQAIMDYQAALKAMDGLAVRQAIRDLLRAMGWEWTSWMVHCTRDWPRHPSQAPRLPGQGALAAATGPKGSLPECPGQGCSDQGCPAHYAS